MDYREVENRLARNREMIKEREYQRMIKPLIEAAKPEQESIWKRLLNWLGALTWNTVEPQSCVPVGTPTRLDQL